MVAKSGINPKEFYAEPKPIMKKKLIVWHQPNRFTSREGVFWDTHGFKFDEGVVYEVNDEVYDFVKWQRGFYEIVDVRTQTPVKFLPTTSHKPADKDTVKR